MSSAFVDFPCLMDNIRSNYKPCQYQNGEKKSYEINLVGGTKMLRKRHLGKNQLFTCRFLSALMSL